MSSLPGKENRITGNRNIIYDCSTCGKPTNRKDLRARRTQWVEMGLGSKVVRSRVTAWDCVPCMEAHADYKRPKFFAARGNQDLEPRE